MKQLKLRDADKLSYRELSERADRYQRMVTERMKRLTAKAGLDPQLLMIHPHNAMCAFRSGRPWPEVNYSLVRKVLWLEREKLWAASRLVDSLYKRGRIYF